MGSCLGVKATAVSGESGQALERDGKEVEALGKEVGERETVGCVQVSGKP